MAAKSVVGCYTGARGSGKTLSLAYQGGLDLLAGRTVFSNFPVAFDYDNEDGNGAYHFESQPLNLEALWSFEKGIANATVLIDEINLWADSRRSMSVTNRLMAAMFQLIRKRALSFYLTCQNFQWLDNRLRWQTDVQVACRDLHYEYRRIEQGSQIAQVVTDLSGLFTGRPFDAHDEDSWNRSVAWRTFHSKPFWVIYDSLQEYDILSTMTKVKIDSGQRVLTASGFQDALHQDDIDGRVKFVIDGMIAEQRDKVSSEDIRRSMAEMGVTTDMRRIGISLKRYGMVRHRPGTGKGDFYTLPEKAGAPA